MIDNAGHLDYLRRAYPRLFREAGMPWGFDHGDGWNQIIESLCDQIDSILREVPDASIAIRQVKEKMGTLRFYYRLQGVDAEREQAIQDAVIAVYAASEQTCERCGNPGVLQETGRCLKTLCAACGGDNSHLVIAYTHNE